MEVLLPVLVELPMPDLAGSPQADNNNASVAAAAVNANGLSALMLEWSLRADEDVFSVEVRCMGRPLKK